MIDLISLGGGVQSSAVALMASRGEITPMPAAAVFADTQDEPAAVYRWLDWLTPQLAFPVYRVTVGRLSDRETLIRTSKKSGKRYRRPLMPMYLDGGAPVFRHCTQDFKLRPLYREYRRLAAGGVVRQWIGISADEAHRARPPRQSWLRNRFPLLELGLTRSALRSWFHREDYPQPPRSACVQCPFHSDSEWDRLKQEEPAEFQRAVEIERRIQATCDAIPQARVYLHRSLQPLDSITFASDGQEMLFGRECMGVCGV